MKPSPTGETKSAGRTRLDAAILASGLSLRAVASASLVPVSTLHRAATGATVLRADDLARVADTLGVPLADLVDGVAA